MYIYVYVLVYIHDTTHSGVRHTHANTYTQPSPSSAPPHDNTNRQYLISEINSMPAALKKRKSVKQIIPFPLLALGEACER